MALVTINIDRNELPPHTDDDFEEWVKFNVGHFGGIELINPLSEIDMDAMVMEIR